MARAKILGQVVSIAAGKSVEVGVPSYCRVGDVLTVYFDAQALSFAERVDGILTLHRDQDDRKRVTGFSIKGFRSLARELMDALSAAARNKDEKTQRLFRTLRDFVILLVGRKHPQPEHVEHYVALLLRDSEELSVPIPWEEITAQPA